jgi:hypothetical protein
VRRTLLALACAALLAAVAVVAVAATAGRSAWRSGAAAVPPRAPALPPRAPVAPSAPRPAAVLWAVGDGADGSRAARAVVARMRTGRIDRLLYLGDVYDAGTAEDFRTHYAPVYGGLAGRTAPTPGNHEWQNRATGYRPYWRRVTGRRMPDFYGFRLGGWQVLSLNSEAPHEAGSPQVRWLRRRLSAAAGTCRLAFWHRPRFSGGLHGDAPDLAPLWDALRGHAKLVVSGHDHDLQRLRSRGGITQLVSGAGGHRRYRLGRDPRRAFGDDRHDGAVRLALRPGAADVRFVAAGGRVLDRTGVRCRPLTPRGA